MTQTQRYQPSRSNYSGPSSLESGKTSSLVTSGPSSIDSGNKSLSLSRNSGHSSLDSSHGSASTVAQSTSHNILNSPRSSSSKHRLIKSSGTMAASTSSSSSKVTTSTSASGIKSTSFDEAGSSSASNEKGLMPNSNSSGSITLQVTNNTHGCSGLPNTKIFVQNSPIHTSITFENGKFMENSNVFVINNETTTNTKGDIIASRKSLMSNSSPSTSPLKQQNQQHHQQQSQLFKRPQVELKQRGSSGTLGKENCFSENDEAASETGDSLSMISETSPDSSLIPYVDDDITDDGDSRRQNNVQSPENCSNRASFKNINRDNDASMNNRKFSLPLGSSSTTTMASPANTTTVYNNMLKNHYNQQTNAIISPVYQHNKMNLFSNDIQHQQPNVGSVGNLKMDKQINSDCDLKNALLNSNPTINSDSLFNIFQKNIIAVGSEPNLIAIKQNDMKQKINNCVKDGTGGDEKTPTLDSKHDANGLYNFPSLSDLSFNFTSLHAQKILKGGLSVNNSIDTLVELDINKSNTHKSNTNLSPSATICTDFGMV